MKFNKKKLKANFKSISRNIPLKINLNPVVLTQTYLTQFNIWGKIQKYLK